MVNANDIPKLPYGEGTISIYSEELYIYKKTYKSSSGQKKRLTVYGKTIKECFNNMREKERSFEQESNVKASKKILTDALNEWLQLTKLHVLKSTSYDRLESTIRNQIAEYDIGSTRYQQITSSDIQNHINLLVNKNYSFSVIKKTYDLLNDFYRYISKVDSIKNPMINVSLPSKDRLENKSKDIEYFKDDDIQKFIKEAGKQQVTNNKLKHQWGYALAANIYLGLRGGELLALRWKDIDFEKKVINVSKRLAEIVNRQYDQNDPDRMRREGIKKTTYEEDIVKNGKPRFVPLNKKAEELLLAHRTYSVHTKDDDYVINTRTRNHTTLKNLNDAIKSIENNAYTEVKAYNSHVLRHTCASLYFRSGVPIELIASILGHSVEVCREIYVHIMEEQKIEAASQMVNQINLKITL